MGECAHPLDVLGKLFCLGGLAAVIATGIIFVGPVDRESKFDGGICNVTRIYITRAYCTDAGKNNIEYKCVNFIGYYVKTNYPGYYNVSQADEWEGKKVDSNFLMSEQNRTASGRKSCYLTFGDSKQDRPCDTKKNMEITVDSVVNRDFPLYMGYFNLNFTSSSYLSYPNRYRNLSIIYNDICYYSAEYKKVIMHKYGVKWYTVFFVLSWVCVFKGIGLLAKFGEGAAHEFAKWILHMIGLTFYIPFFAINFVLYILTAIVAELLFNYKLPMELEPWINAGGIFIPLVKCYKQQSCACPSCPCAGNTVSEAPEVVISVSQPVPPVVIANPVPAYAPEPAGFDAFNLSKREELPRYEYEVSAPPPDTDWEPPPPSYDEVVK